MKRSFFITFLFLTIFSANVTFLTAQVKNEIDWREQIIYMALTDRFYNGDKSNDELGACDCFDPANPLKYHGGDLKGFRDKMGYLKELGVTALWTSPLYEQVPLHAVNAGRDEERDNTPACGYHGYVINFRDPDDRAIEPKFGDDAELKGLISDLKANNMHIIFDMLVNQAGWNADIVDTHPNWFNKLEDNEKDNSCAYLDVTHMCIYGLPDFKIDDPVVGKEVRHYLNEMSKGWVREYDLAGIRFDAPMLVPPSYFKEWFKEIRSVKPELFIFAETYDYNRPQNYKGYLEKGFNGTLNFYLQGGFKETFAYGKSTGIIAENVQNTIEDLGIEQTLLMVNFIDNHDVARFMTNTSGEEVNESKDYRRQQLGIAALLTLPGIPQIYYGNEVGAYGGYPDNRRDMPEWVWNKETRHGEHEFFLTNMNETFEFTKQLIKLRKENDALTKGNYVELFSQQNENDPDVYAFIRYTNDNVVLVLINNSDAKSGTVNIKLNGNPKITGDLLTKLQNTKIIDKLNMRAPEEIEIKEGKISFEMNGKSAGVYSVDMK